MTDLVSRPYHPDPKHCCEACVFGKGEHTCPELREAPLSSTPPAGDSSGVSNA